MIRKQARRRRDSSPSPPPRPEPPVYEVHFPDSAERYTQQRTAAWLASCAAANPARITRARWLLLPITQLDAAESSTASSVSATLRASRQLYLTPTTGAHALDAFALPDGNEVWYALQDRPMLHYAYGAATCSPEDSASSSSSDGEIGFYDPEPEPDRLAKKPPKVRKNGKIPTLGIKMPGELEEEEKAEEEAVSVPKPLVKDEIVDRARSKLAVSMALAQVTAEGKKGAASPKRVSGRVAEQRRRSKRARTAQA